MLSAKKRIQEALHREKRRVSALPTQRHTVQGGRTRATPVLLLSGHTDLTASRSVTYNTLPRQAQKNV